MASFHLWFGPGLPWKFHLQASKKGIFKPTINQVFKHWPTVSLSGEFFPRETSWSWSTLQSDSSAEEAWRGTILFKASKLFSWRWLAIFVSHKSLLTLRGSHGDLVKTLDRGRCTCSEFCSSCLCHLLSQDESLRLEFSLKVSFSGETGGSNAMSMFKNSLSSHSFHCTNFLKLGAFSS